MSEQNMDWGQKRSLVENRKMHKRSRENENRIKKNLEMQLTKSLEYQLRE